jgi:hypothetical protein
MVTTARILSTAVLAAGLALGKTDLEGCTSFETVATNRDGVYFTRLWYVPDTGEICELLECGGGRAPPKTTLPGCDAYAGTETYSPRFLDPKTLGGAAPQTTAAASTTTTDEAETATTEAPASDSTSDSATSSAGVTLSEGFSSRPAETGSTETTSAAPSSTEDPGSGAAAAMPTGVMLGSWVAAGVAAWAGMM